MWQLRPLIFSVVLANLVLCVPVFACEAAQQDKTLRVHCAHLLIHGTLHARGWDHETGPEDTEAVEARETAILVSPGHADPYHQTGLA
jgi:probable rRNA maturation factor